MYDQGMNEEEYKKSMQREQAEKDAQNYLHDMAHKKMPENDVELLYPILTPEGSTSRHKVVSNGEIVDAALPFKEMLTTNLSTANYNDKEKQIAFSLAHIGATQKFISMQMGVDLSVSADYFTDLMNLLSAITKGYLMAAPMLIRTTRSEAQVKQESVMEERNQKKKKGWLF